METPSALLGTHHRELQAACSDLRDAICGADPAALLSRYRRFEQAVLDQFATEAEVLLPTYAERFPATARQLVQEHAAIRRLLRHVAIDIELQVVRVDQLDILLDRLRANAGFEEATLYRWADQRLDAEATAALVERLQRPARVERATSRFEHTGFSR